MAARHNFGGVLITKINGASLEPTMRSYCDAVHSVGSGDAAVLFAHPAARRLGGGRPMPSRRRSHAADRRLRRPRTAAGPPGGLAPSPVAFLPFDVPLAPYVRDQRLFYCPSADEFNRGKSRPDGLRNDYFLSTLVNDFLWDADGHVHAVGKLAVAQPNPSSTVMCGDATGSMRTLKYVGEMPVLGIVRHLSGANFVFMDGHTKFMSDTMEYRVWCLLQTPDGEHCDLPGTTVGSSTPGYDFYLERTSPVNDGDLK